MPASASADSRRQNKRGVLGSSLTPREAELLTVTLEVLRETGYDKFTVDQVAARAHASKTTVYRRWPSKAELVCAAFADLIQREQGLPADSGSLRDDLLRLAEIIARDADEYGRTIAGILAAGERSPRLRELLVDDLQRARKEQFHGILQRAVTRGEIYPEVISEDIWDVLPAYIMFLVLQHRRPVPAGTLQAFVDEVLLPSLTRLPS
ncbi:TetR/AcrR family transcriptional regulator [Trebonia kvetii]|uniref:TetR/AcrR family transcriptional regulator n=1 Tax=Trebonia kvetii TaxID=2480626 RepID=A0A6P2BXW2_9ACTN|nr:TetR/AcrR family transcriptional regulator [Trebonia kvetii]TVZ03932.1 TetR/AcrR family transcriptional regulator [Trebonia kvetii]